jgi:hypothetical protein
MSSNPAPRLRLLAPCLVLLGAATTGCDAGPEDAPAVVAGEPDRVEKDLLDLVAASTPLPATAPAVDQSDWHLRRRATLERLRAASHEHGLAALVLFEEKAQAEPALRADLLDVAAHAAPQETSPHLIRLVTEYGPDPLLRRRATELLGDVLPVAAIDVLEPVLRGEVRGRTLPPDDTVLGAWYQAATTLQRDRAPLLCSVATDLRREAAVRYQATRLLGEAPSPQGNAALEQLAVESTGDHLIRRYAVQSLQKVLAEDEFCSRMLAILDKEADINFQIFLQDVLEESCR